MTNIFQFMFYHSNVIVLFDGRESNLQEYQSNAVPTELCGQVTWPHMASIPKVVGSIPTMARHIFQASPVWIYTQSNITNIIFNWVHNIITEKNHFKVIVLITRTFFDNFQKVHIIL
jgi:hypothetical protein